MKLFFWSAKRLLLLSGWLIGTVAVLGIIFAIFRHVHAPDTAYVVAVTTFGAFAAVMLVRSIVLQAKHNAAPPPHWLDRKPPRRDR